MRHCAICHLPGNLLMCSPCFRDFYAMLGTIARLVPELDVELMKRTAKNSKMQRASGGHAIPLPYSPDASELADYGLLVMNTWLGLALPWTDVTNFNLRELAKLAYFNVGRMIRVPDVPLMFEEMRNLRDGLIRLADLPTERVFLGPCAACGASVHGDPATEYLECRCGAQIATQAARTAVRDEVEQNWLTPKETRAYLKGRGALISAQVLSNWGREEKVRKQVVEGASFYLLSSVVSYARERGLLEPAKVG